MENNFVVTSSPFIRNTNISTSKIMLEVIIALFPTVIASVVIFGIKALILILLCVCSCVFFEWAFQKISKKKSTINDLSAVVTGIILGFNLPVTAPFWIPIIGSLIAIILVKQLFGGLGQNFVNPALVSRIILFISWVSLMAARIVPEVGNMLQAFNTNDYISVATPLAFASPEILNSGNSAITFNYTLSQLFLGNIPGMIGETCKLTLLIGGLYLMLKGIIDWRIPITFIATVFILYFLQTGIIYTQESGMLNPVNQILSGGLILGAFFMATDYVTCPLHKTGRIIMGVGCGVLLFVIRAFGSYPEGCSFAILFMNIATPLIDRYTRPKSFGEV